MLQINEMYAYERSNKFNLMFIRMTILNNIITSLPPTTNAQKYLRVIENIFKSINKLHINNRR